MQRLVAALTLGIGLSGCTADGPTAVDRGIAAHAIVPAALLMDKCVYSTKDDVRIADSEDCEPNAFGLDVSFVGTATIKVGALVRSFDSPAGITGLRTMIDLPTGEITDMQWMQGTRVLSQSVFPPLAFGSKEFDVKARKIIDARWIGGGRISVPKDANDFHYFVPRVF